MDKYFSNELVELYNGDCIETMVGLIGEGKKVDKIITSPPYNIIRPNSTDRGYDVYKDSLLSNEQYSKWIVNIFTVFDAIMNPNGCIMFNMSYGTENTECMSLTIAEILKRTNFTLADIIVLKKRSATPNNVSSNKMTRICEFVYVFCRRDEFFTFSANKEILSNREKGQPIYNNVFNFFEADNNDFSTDLNKATFSTQFVDNMINRYVTDGDVVLDCFSGTGTTVNACYQRGIKAIGIELSKEQCEFAKTRLNNAQFRLF